MDEYLYFVLAGRTPEAAGLDRLLAEVNKLQRVRAPPDRISRRTA